MMTALLYPAAVGVLPGAATTVVIVKTTFTLDRSPVATGVDPPEPLSALDFVASKPRCDILLVGHAVAVKPARALPVRFVVGDFEKRFFACAAEPTCAIPLQACYLRSTLWGEAGTLGVGPQPPGPNLAPADQQVPVLRSSVRLVLEGLSRGGARRDLCLPGLEPRVFAMVRPGARGPERIEDVTMPCDTLWIDADRGICTLTYRGTLGVPSAEAVLVVAAGREDVPLAWAAVAAQLHAARWVTAVEGSPVVQGDRAERGERTELLSTAALLGARSVLPFDPDAQPTLAATTPHRVTRAPDVSGKEITASIDVEAIRATGSALPFAEAQRVAASFGPAASAAAAPAEPASSAAAPAEPASSAAKPAEPASSAAKPAGAAGDELRLSLDKYASIKAELWAGVDLCEALGRHATDEHTFWSHERWQAEALRAAARAGDLAPAVALRRALRQAQASVAERRCRPQEVGP